jgi:hypothetical protein
MSVLETDAFMLITEEAVHLRKAGTSRFFGVGFCGFIQKKPFELLFPKLVFLV